MRGGQNLNLSGAESLRGQSKRFNLSDLTISIVGFLFVGFLTKKKKGLDVTNTSTYPPFELIRFELIRFDHIHCWFFVCWFFNKEKERLGCDEHFNLSTI